MLVAFTDKVEHALPKAPIISKTIAPGNTHHARANTDNLNVPAFNK